MALQLSETIKNKSLNNLFRPETLYASIPTTDGAPQSADLPRAVINFNAASNGQISLTSPVQLVVSAGTTINRVYLHTSGLTGATTGSALVRIDLTGDDVERYDNNGVYIINTINVAMNT